MPAQVQYMISNAFVEDWDMLMKLATDINLDRNDIHFDQFKVCKSGDRLVGIGRIKKNSDCLELCTLGVAEAFRGMGIGRALVRTLLKPWKEPVYLVTDIPRYFEKLGFRRSRHAHKSLIEKQRNCREKLECRNPVIMIRRSS
jgi:N-acetylglutamate synthase-like GNAT family acetyltransferase